MKRRAESFDDRLRPIASRLYGYARALAADAESAADLYQETILRAISSPAVPEGERLFRAWLFTIMRNYWIDRLRMQRRQPELDALEDDRAVEAFMPASLETMVVNQIAVRQAFAMLCSRHRDVLTLVDIGGFSYDEAAEMLGVPRGTIMSRVSRARQALCRLLAEENVTMHPSAGRSAGR